MCASTQVCSRSACANDCAVGELKCGQSCVNAQTDGTNCGFCGNVCGGGQSCVNAACACPSGQTTCSGVCVDTSSSTTHCGACGVMCPTGQSCSAGVCSGGAGGNGAGGSSGSGTGGGAGTAGNASGGTGGSDVIPPGRNGCAITPGLLADFEEGGTMPVLVQHEDRTGEWEVFNDGSATNQTSTVEATGGTEMCDKYALHVKGSGYSTWGAGFGFSLVGPKTAPTPYNATAKSFTGIRFKAKLGATADAKSPVRFNISTPWTESSENPGGQCMPTTATTNKSATDCYQHAGRFLSPGTAADQLTTTFKEFTYCFDRDLYPLSLPSNLTTEQRNNIASAMLKVQFQFNQGKDYSGPYPSDAVYPDFSKALPFDFWVDDLEFITGECPNMVPQTNNGSPMKPFPQNTGIGTCTPATNAPKFAAAIANAYQNWTRTFVMGSTIVAPEQQGAITSEAMGYGMMIAAAMGDKAAFDKFHGYVKNQGGMGAGNLMTWKNGGSGSATDGDIDIAFALLMAHAQWPTGGYKTASDDMASGILSKDIVGNVIRGGSQYRDSNFNPSYFAPAAFAKFSGFGAAQTKGYEMVNNNVGGSKPNTTAGIPTDWGNPESGLASGPGSAQVTSDIIDGDNGAMGYDAARVPWRLGLHACQGGDKTALTAIVNLFASKYDMGASIDLMKAGWYKTTGMPHTAAKDLQGSYIGPIGVGAMAMGNTAMKDRAFRTMLDILESGDFNHTYFPSTVGLLTALAMSGNFPMP
jgi:endo-1,4-beta-D-glucanase Y